MEGNLVKKGVKISFLMCHGQTGKKSLLKPWKNAHFSTFSPTFPSVPPKNLALPPIYKLRIELSSDKVLCATLKFVVSGSI